MAPISSFQFRHRFSNLHSIMETSSKSVLADKRIHQQPVMEKQSQDEIQDGVNRLEERDCKGSCEIPTNSKKISDEIMPHVLNLYGSCATPKDFEIYAQNATFEDPLMKADGIRQIKSAFYSLSKAFSESRIVEYSVKENVIAQGKHEILIDNMQYYKFMGKGIDVISLIKLYVEGGKVVRHEDLWDKKPLWNHETVKLPLAGRLIDMTKKGSMFITHALMRFGKDPTVEIPSHTSNLYGKLFCNVEMVYS